MPLPNFSFLLGIVLLVYLSTFVLFALVRVLTGVSVQRISFRGLRRIAYAPRDGIAIHIHGIGLSIHRPTFNQPSYFTLTITEPQVTLDLEALQRSRAASDKSSANSHADSKSSASAGAQKRKGKGQVFTKLIDLKEKIKKLHGQVHWLRLIDLTIVGAAVQVKNVGSVRLERFILSVDTRPKAVSRERLFQHGHDTEPSSNRPAEWKIILRSLLLSPEGKFPIEMMDFCAVSIHGFLVEHLEGLRNASINVKMGRLTIPFDELDVFTDHVKATTPPKAQQVDDGVAHSTPVIQQNGVPIDDSDLDPIDEEPEQAAAINDGKAFATSILRGIHEVQLALGAFACSKRIKSLRSGKNKVYFNVAMKEVGLDLTRLDPQSPAHRQYFSHKDVSHQALLTAISMGARIDDGEEHAEQMLYIPMLTATVRTTLPFKLLQVATEGDDGDKNSNILFANLVCTSPSIDLDPKHLPLLLSLIHSEKKHEPPKKAPLPTKKRKNAFYKLLPRAIVKIAIQEPVIRVSLPRKGGGKEYDMIISSVSTMVMDVDAQHNPDLETHYALFLDYRHTNHRLYGQSNDGVRHELLFADTVEFKVDVNALPEMTVIVGGKLNDFSLYLTEPEICEGIRRIILSMRKETQSHQATLPEHAEPKVSFLRKAPCWLQHVHIEGSDFDFEMAGVEPAVSKYARGVSFHVDSWSVEHKINRDEEYQLTTRRRSSSKPSHRETSPKQRSPDEPRRRRQSPTDGRRLAVHVDGLEGLLIDSLDEAAGDPFLALPKFEVAFSTSTDSHGPLLHINSMVDKLYVIYSLYHMACFGNAVLLARKTFTPACEDAPIHEQTETKEEHAAAPSQMAPPPVVRRASHDNNPEVTAIDFRARLIQVKATMPADPNLMLHIYELEAGKHRWASPFARTKLARIYAASPGMQGVWSRIVTIRSARFDIRSMNRKVDNKYITEKSFDISAEAIRIGVPHQLVVHAIFDNFINLLKTNQQLHHNFVTGRDEYILTKHPEGPKHLPKVSIRSQVFIFEIEDSPFEFKLGMIYRVGLVEQRQRRAREHAFELKEKKIKRSDRDAHGRSRSLHPPGRDHKKPSESDRSRSATPRSKRRRGEEKPCLRYDTQGRCEMGGHISRSVDEAREALDRFNASSWKRRIDRAWTQRKHVMKEINQLFAAIDDLSLETEETEPIMATPLRPGLFSLSISDLGVSIDKPSFPLSQLPDFLHKVGKGMPKDMEYGLLIPLHLNITMGELKGLLRDYPLPLISIPAIKPGQSPKLASLSLSSDFVIAEEFQGVESQRHIPIAVVPKEKLGPNDEGDGYYVDVIRTVSPVKMYNDMNIDINTSSPTRFTWGTSIQPAIQDMMQVIETFTKPQMDPSEPVGFWDKIRLSFHSRILVSWKGDGDVHLNLKGSRDPYVVTGDGAGFVMVWRNNVQLSIARDEDPRKFMTVDSGDYLFAIPDWDAYARTYLEGDDASTDDRSISSSTDSSKSTAMFKKVIMKLSGNVQWLLGLMFEHEDGPDGERSFKFKPHYDVFLKHPKFAKPDGDKPYDAFRGFRSHHIHMSVAISAPKSRDWDVQNTTPSNDYNAIHLTPRFFTHFFKWWSLFSGVMSLPVRQGPLWGGEQKTSKKFGRHLGTIKYNILLSPVFIAHIYKHKEMEDYASDSVAATGLKIKIDSFMLDLHQRREYFKIATQKGGYKTTSGMKMNQGQLDFISADFRAVSASIKGTNLDDIENLGNGVLSTHQSAADMSKFTIPDNDFTWIDMDDFVELDWILPQESTPETKILPLAFTPRFTYTRQTDHGDTISGDEGRSSPFGDEPTHFCIMTQNNDPKRVQAVLCKQRLEKLTEQIATNGKAITAEEKKLSEDTSDNKDLRKKLEVLKSHEEVLRRKHAFLHGMLREIHHRLGDDVGNDPWKDDTELQHAKTHVPDEIMAEGLKSIPTHDESKDFNNRFIVHNAQIKWNNSLRNIVLRYIHQVSQRRGFVYYMSRRAVKFILDIIEERKHKEGAHKNDGETSQPLSPQLDDDMTIEERIAQLMADGKDFVHADDDSHSKSGQDHDESEEISNDFLAQNTYFFRLVAPQIQLQSEKNSKSVVLITAKGMHFKVVQIMDKERLLDDISGLVQRRFSAVMDSMQIFVTSTQTFSTEFLHLYSGNRYGAKAGTLWPPWVPIEVMYVFAVNPYGFSRVVQRTSASFKMDKYNQLRLKYNDDVSKSKGSSKREESDHEHRLDHLTIEFPQFKAICDSSQYYAMYMIATDLLLYSEPLEKNRSERLEKILLASDFSDLTGAPELVETLQHRIRQLEEIKLHFEINEALLDLDGWKDRITMNQDLTQCEDELFFMMKAITTSQQKRDERHKDSAHGVLHWYIMAKELAWHLVGGNEQKFLEFQVRDTSFERTDNSDGSNQNSIECGRINGYNFLPNALYRELIAPYVDEKEGIGETKEKMLRVQWLMLEAIAGIPVVDYFEVDVIPLHVQLERKVAKKLFEYIFPGSGGTAFEGSGVVPMKKMIPNGGGGDESDDETEDTNPISTAPEPKAPEGEEKEKPKPAATGAGSLEQRLQPTLRLTDNKHGAKKSGKHSNGSHWSLFQHRNRSSVSTAPRTNGNTPRASVSNLDLSRVSSNNSEDSRSVTDKATSPTSTAKSHDFPRTKSKSKDDDHNHKDKDKAASDDLTQMLSRASNYMTLSYFHIHSLILCLSYKGQGKRNIEDVHDLVFRLPSIEYRNKTWSNLDLAVEMKKEVIRALIAQAGRIVSNKFSRAPKRVTTLVNGDAAAKDSLLLGSNGVTATAGRDVDVAALRRQSTLPRLKEEELDAQRDATRIRSEDTRPASSGETKFPDDESAAAAARRHAGSQSPRQDSHRNGQAGGAVVEQATHGFGVSAGHTGAQSKRDSIKSAHGQGKQDDEVSIKDKEKKGKGRRLWRFSSP